LQYAAGCQPKLRSVKAYKLLPAFARLKRLQIGRPLAGYKACNMLVVKLYNIDSINDSPTTRRRTTRTTKQKIDPRLHEVTTRVNFLVKLVPLLLSEQLLSQRVELRVDFCCDFS
jgi:hypothetical protein